jgi:hypothetical protein
MGILRTTTVDLLKNFLFFVPGISPRDRCDTRLSGLSSKFRLRPFTPLDPPVQTAVPVPFEAASPFEPVCPDYRSSAGL